MLVAVGVVVVLVVVGFAVYLHFGGGGTATTAPEPTKVATAAAAGQKADPVHDLRVVSAKMDKDPTGTTALWLVEFRNQSPAYTYSKISYETTYAGADNSVLLQNHGEIAISIGPGESQSAQVRDALYPSGTAWYKFRVLDAAASVQ